MSTAALVQCTIFGNRAAQGSGIAECCCDIAATNTIVAYNAGGAAFGGGPGVDFSCCDVYGNEGGDWVGPLAGLYGVNGNICADPLFCDPDGHDFMLQDDSPCRGHTPESPDCDRMGAWPAGCGSSGVDDRAIEASLEASLEVRVIPNPTSGPCHVLFRAERPDPVQISVFDAAGRSIREIHHGWSPAGERSVYWDGNDELGHALPAGVYLVRITAGTGTSGARMVVSR